MMNTRLVAGCISQQAQYESQFDIQGNEQIPPTPQFPHAYLPPHLTPSPTTPSCITLRRYCIAITSL